MKNSAYARARILLAANEIKDFQEIASVIQKKTLVKDLSMHFDTLQARILDPGKWTIHQLATLSDLLEIDHSILMSMADRLRKQKKKGRK
jgi:hypothetical protein